MCVCVCVCVLTPRNPPPPPLDPPLIDCRVSTSKTPEKALVVNLPPNSSIRRAGRNEDLLLQCSVILPIQLTYVAWPRSSLRDQPVEKAISLTNPVKGTGRHPIGLNDHKTQLSDHELGPPRVVLVNMLMLLAVKASSDQRSTPEADFFWGGLPWFTLG